MKLSAIIAPLLHAKAPHDQILDVVMAFEAQQDDALERAETQLESIRAKGRERFHRWKAGRRANVSQRERTSATRSKRPARAEDRISNTEIEPQEKNVRDAHFDQFWRAYPHKVGKPRARSAFKVAIIKADLSAILAGVARYVAAKPADRPWLNPSTFLTQERWADEPAAITPSPATSPRPAAQPNPVRSFIAGLRDELDAADERAREIGSDRSTVISLPRRERGSGS